MDQIIGIVDSYGYWPLVRQVFSHRVFRPRDRPAGRRGRGRRRVCAGAAKVLAALEALAAPERSRRTGFVAGRPPSWRDDRLLRGRRQKARPC